MSPRARRPVARLPPDGGRPRPAQRRRPAGDLHRTGNVRAHGRGSCRRIQVFQAALGPLNDVIGAAAGQVGLGHAQAGLLAEWEAIPLGNGVRQRGPRRRRKPQAGRPTARVRPPGRRGARGWPQVQWALAQVGSRFRGCRERTARKLGGQVGRSARRAVSRGKPVDEQPPGHGRESRQLWAASSVWAARRCRNCRRVAEPVANHGRDEGCAKRNATWVELDAPCAVRSVRMPAASRGIDGIEHFFFAAAARAAQGGQLGSLVPARQRLVRPGGPGPAGAPGARMRSASAVGTPVSRSPSVASADEWLPSSSRKYGCLGAMRVQQRSEMR